MKTQIAASIFALTISLSGMTPALAGSFNERGPDWTTIDQMSSHSRNSYQDQGYQTPDGSFASSWGSGKTPSEYRGPSSSSARLDTGRSCDLAPRVGFNETNNFPTC
jgi:hypothetical protein